SLRRWLQSGQQLVVVGECIAEQDSRLSQPKKDAAIYVPETYVLCSKVTSQCGFRAVRAV
ncbi:MAG TPA: hypothetical protein VIJ25_13995, partial [Methylococcales bacterium]